MPPRCSSYMLYNVIYILYKYINIIIIIFIINACYEVRKASKTGHKFEALPVCLPNKYGSLNRVPTERITGSSFPCCPFISA